MVTPAAAERFLAAPLLAQVAPESRRAVLEVLAERREPAGATLLEQGQSNDHISFLIEGTAVVQRAYAEGRVETVATLAAPSVFGETSFFRDTPPIVTVRAQTPAWLLTLDHPAHERLRQTSPRAAEELAVAAVRVLAERFDLLDRRVSDFLRQNPDGPAKANEWARFRARLFEEPNL